MEDHSPKSAPTVIVAYPPGNDALTARSEAIARQLNLPVRELPGNALSTKRGRRGQSAAFAVDELQLWVLRDGLALQDAGDVKLSPIRVDFDAGMPGFRRRSAQSRRQPLARAVGVKGESIDVLDCTAGLGRDAFQLCCLGCRVTAVERSPILCEMLRDAMDRATNSADESLRKAIARLSLVCGESASVLRAFSENARPDAVYIDPMYTTRRKSAAGGAEMRILRRLVGDDEDSGSLLAIARKTAGRRVVVKRLRHHPALAEKVDICYSGRTVRYDVYLTGLGQQETALAV